MVLAATFSIVSLGMGMRIWCHEGESLRSQNAIVLLFLSGEMAATFMWRVGGGDGSPQSRKSWVKRGWLIGLEVEGHGWRMKR